jgi:3-hydroxyisobutyrate dehydrogenase-like beta-hydroxyacid dehydrogenase
MKTIAILGTGEMGSRMARRLLAAGHKVYAYNRTAARARPLAAAGAILQPSAREAAIGAEVVIAMVTDDAAAREVWLDPRNGALAGLGNGSIAIESSTVTPAWAAELAGRVEAAGRRFLDAPVVGSRPQAEGGALIHLVGGEAETLDAARDVLACLGSAIHHLGPAGAGATCKLAVNALFGCQVAALSELIGVLRRAGIDARRATALFGALPVMSPALGGVSAQIASRSFAPLFPVSLVEKDFRYLLATAQALRAATPTCEAVHELFANARRKGHGNENISAVAQLFE